MSFPNLVKLNDGTVIGDKVVTVKTFEEEETGTLVALVSTDSVDSDNDVIHQNPNEHGQGWKLDRFNNHPVMLWSHNIYTPTLGGGKAWVGESELGKGLHFVPVFDVDDPFAAQIEGKIRRGFITETSVGFSSKNFDRRQTGEDTGWPGYDFWESELVEISWVNRGANPDVDSMFKSMVKRDPGLLSRVDTVGDKALAEIKACLVDRVDELFSRVKGMEEALFIREKMGQDNRFNDMLKALEDGVRKGR